MRLYATVCFPRKSMCFVVAFEGPRMLVDDTSGIMGGLAGKKEISVSPCMYEVWNPDKQKWLSLLLRIAVLLIGSVIDTPKN